MKSQLEQGWQSNILMNLGSFNQQQLQNDRDRYMKYSQGKRIF